MRKILFGIITLSMLIACEEHNTGQATVAPITNEMSVKADPGVAYLEKNKSKEGVVTLPSGLQYEVIKSGPEGPKATMRDQVTTHYHGTLIDGSVFDSSVQRGQPISFGVGQVIPGWTQALQLMNVGDKWRLHIPSDLGYGSRGAGPIPPNSVLIFEVELLAIPTQK